MAAHSRPLDGMLVVSIEQAIAAPYCSRLLADQGARVIKIERPEGDFARAYDARTNGLSSHFVWTNRSKESLVLDLKQIEAQDCLHKLISKADIFIQNLAPGAAARLGFASEQLRQVRPSLITCSISGFGETGPQADRKAYDLLIQAEAGFLSVTGDNDQLAKAGISIADIAAGVSAYNGILAALLQRHKTGVGDHLDISMLEATAEWMGFPMYFAYDGAPPPPRNGAGHATIFPYGPFETADGAVLFGIQNDREWRKFCSDVLQRDDLGGDPKYLGNTARADNRESLEPVIRAIIQGMPTSHALEKLQGAGIATAEVKDMAGLWHHDQLTARQRWQTFGSPAGPLPGLLPITGQAWSPQMTPVPALGEHSAAILDELDLDPAIKAAILAAQHQD